MQAVSSNKHYQVYDHVRLQDELARHIADLSREFIKRRGKFTVVLSGGYLIDQLCKLPKQIIDWSNWYIFWVDERVVGWDSDDSNYKLALDGFLSKVSIPSENIIAIDGKLGKEGKAAAAAVNYETRIKKLVDAGVIEKSPDGLPKFDLQLLGMGPDGHIASLFPGRIQVLEKRKWVTYVIDSPKPPAKRITFTLPVINASSNIVFVMVGYGEADAVAKVLNNVPSHPPLPASLVSAQTDQKWFLDKMAASKLNTLR